MTLNDIINELQARKEALEWEYSKIESKLEEIRKLAKTGENLKEKIISIGFAITRLESIQMEDVVESAVDAWGGIGE